jgi:splicing factor U2AF subunit
MGREDENRDRDRDRDRKGDKKKRRSASSESAERSREREKRRRKQQQEYVNKNRGPGAGAGQSMFWDGFQWVPRADTNGNDANANRKNRRLYLGNLPYHLGVTEDSFSKQLYETMRDRGMCNDPNQNPVLHVWFARDKGANYGFCEVASLEETERALQLDGMLVLGVPVSIKRPNDSVSPMGMIGGIAVGMQALPGAGGGMLALPAVQVSATSPIIHIDEILKVDSKTTKDDYTDVAEDMKEGCGAHGKLHGVLIIRPEHAQGRPGLKPGDVYLHCATTDDATKVMRAMGHRKYDGRQINMTSFEEGKFMAELKPLM